MNGESIQELIETIRTHAEQQDPADPQTQSVLRRAIAQLKGGEDGAAKTAYIDAFRGVLEQVYGLPESAITAALAPWLERMMDGARLDSVFREFLVTMARDPPPGSTTRCDALLLCYTESHHTMLQQTARINEMTENIRDLAQPLDELEQRVCKKRRSTPV